MHCAKPWGNSCERGRSIKIIALNVYNITYKWGDSIAIQKVIREYYKQL